MRRVLKNAALLLLISVVVISSNRCTQKKKYKYPFQNPDLSFEERADNLVSKMTLDEKLSQLTHGALAIDSLGVPAYNWWNEAIHGVARSENVTVFPQVIGMAATFDPELINKEGDITSSEARAINNDVVKKTPKNITFGLDFWAPNINIFRDPRWGRGQETYGEDPYLTSTMAIAFVKGLQGTDPKYLKVVSTPKHFAVHSGPESSRHSDNFEPSKRDLWETYLPAFEATVTKGGAYSVMSAYNRLYGVPCCANTFLLNDILRKKWGFKGYVATDCGALDDFWHGHHFTKDAASAAEASIKGGCDPICDGDFETFKDAAKRGILKEKDVNVAVTRLMLARFKLGMFDPPEMVPYTKIPFNYKDSKENREVSLQVSKESMVLLKNQNNTLPLDKSKIKSIAVIGPLANNVDVLHGNYNGFTSINITVYQGIKEKAGADMNVSYAKGCDLLTPDFKSVPIPEKNLKGGLKGEYFNNMNLEGTPVLVRTDKTIDFDWQGDSPDPKVNKCYFSVRWTGKLVADKTGDYEIAFKGDDGFRVFIDNKKVIDDWHDKYYGAWMYTYKINLVKGQEHDIKVEYYQNAGSALAKLGWVYPGAIDKYIKTNYAKTVKVDNMFAKQLAAKSDVIVFVGGITSMLESEDSEYKAPGFFRGDRTSMDLTEPQEKLLKELQKLNKPIIFVMMNGSAMSINWENENLPAILEAWYPGEEGGTAVADVLFGNYNPAGRLPLTFYTSMKDLPDFKDYNMQNRTYRYYKGKVLYPFGFGLSYTKFDYSGLKFSKNNINSKDSLIVSVDIKNSGNYDGDEVVQLYIKDITSKAPQPIKSLKGFKRINLKKGESKTVQIALKADAVKYFDEQKNDYIVEPGTYEIQIGASSDDIRVHDNLIIK